MSGYNWFVFSCEDSHGRQWAFARRISRNHNLVGFATMPNVYAMNACSSKDEALRIADGWNKAFQENGTYNAIWTAQD